MCASFDDLSADVYYPNNRLFAENDILRILHSIQIYGFILQRRAQRMLLKSTLGLL